MSTMWSGSLPRSDQWARTHPPAPLLNALLHSDWTAKLLLPSEMFAAAPCPEPIHAHLSPFSAPLPSSQPLLGKGSVTVSAYSCPPTIERPSKYPFPNELLALLTKFIPPDPPASG